MISSANEVAIEAIKRIDNKLRDAKKNKKNKKLDLLIEKAERAKSEILSLSNTVRHTRTDNSNSFDTDTSIGSAISRINDIEFEYQREVNNLSIDTSDNDFEDDINTVYGVTASSSGPTVLGVAPAIVAPAPIDHLSEEEQKIMDVITGAIEDARVDNDAYEFSDEFLRATEKMALNVARDVSSNGGTQEQAEKAAIDGVNFCFKLTEDKVKIYIDKFILDAKTQPLIVFSVRNHVQLADKFNTAIPRFLSDYVDILSAEYQRMKTIIDTYNKSTERFMQNRYKMQNAILLQDSKSVQDAKLEFESKHNINAMDLKTELETTYKEKCDTLFGEIDTHILPKLNSFMLLLDGKSNTHKRLYYVTNITINNLKQTIKIFKAAIDELVAYLTQPQIEKHMFIVISSLNTIDLAFALIVERYNILKDALTNITKNKNPYNLVGNLSGVFNKHFKKQGFANTFKILKNIYLGDSFSKNVNAGDDTSVFLYVTKLFDEYKKEANAIKIAVASQNYNHIKTLIDYAKLIEFYVHLINKYIKFNVVNYFTLFSIGLFDDDRKTIINKIKPLNDHKFTEDTNFLVSVGALPQDGAAYNLVLNTTFKTTLQNTMDVMNRFKIEYTNLKEAFSTFYKEIEPIVKQYTNHDAGFLGLGFGFLNGIKYIGGDENADNLAVASCLGISLAAYMYTLYILIAVLILLIVYLLYKILYDNPINYSQTDRSYIFYNS